MELEKWVPWNWFRKEEENVGTTVPVQHAKTQRRAAQDYKPVTY